MQKTYSIFKNGKYVNPFGSTNKTFGDMVSYLWNRPKVLPLTEHEKTHVHPVLPVDFDKIASDYDPTTTIRSTWIGHSTVLVQMEGYTFITDPVWSKRCTPLPGFPAGPARYRDPPCSINDLPKLDFVILSHNHYDHLDADAVQQIGNTPKWFVPKGMKAWFKSVNIDNVIELDWWEEATFNDDLTLVCTPCQHYSQRTMTDRYAVLWGSWCVLGKHKRFHFAGDTAKCDVFNEIGHFYGPFDYSLIPIGAYDLNREFMKTFHCNVPEAVEIHQQLKSKRSMGVHWGTYLLSTEPLLEPPTLLKSESAQAGLKEDEFFASKIGVTTDIIG
ncbi:hypothetical protein CYY_003085 [Polysphondylium violaceum]|uniref:Metallo-beta-lactamase domain-containing protein n=1 Tax=Polysphondylium violaceum TaxID=133409 RepID=A0A8J4V697_9MYCE|nr:hypothetical protein CYY_003085 [Polysphondylium violaceum]